MSVNTANRGAAAVMARLGLAAAFLAASAGSTGLCLAQNDGGRRAAAAAGGQGAAVEIAGVIDAVTVFRGQALVSRQIELTGAAGLREVVVPNLPQFVVPGSLYAEGEGGAEVRIVSYRERPLVADSRAEVQAKEKDVRAAGDALEALRSRVKLMEWQRSYLEKFDQFVTATAVVENAKGVLNAETLTKLSEYALSQRTKQTTEWTQLSLDVRKAEETLALAQRELGVMTAATNRTAREAVIFVNLTQPGGRLRLNYLVNRADWSPSYNLRADDTKKISVEYQALIEQTSGEDWNNVLLTLSTATPALVSAGPRLDSLSIALAAPRADEGAMNRQSYADAKGELRARQLELASNRNLGANAPMSQQSAGRPAGDSNQLLTGLAGYEQDRGLNDLAAKDQLLDWLTTERVDKASRAKGAPRVEEGVSVTYTLPSRTGLPSRPDRQLVQISRAEAPAVFTKVATPLLTSYVYNEATVTNAGASVLLAGPTGSYLGGQFVGRGALGTIAAGQTFTAGFGIDTSLRSARELVERTESIQGGNRVVETTYRLTLENFGREPAKVRLIDRVPVGKDGQIKVTVTHPAGQEPLKDAATEQSDKKAGLLRWDVTVPAGANAATAASIEYKVRLEYDKQMSITEAPGK